VRPNSGLQLTRTPGTGVAFPLGWRDYRVWGVRAPLRGRGLRLCRASLQLKPRSVRRTSVIEDVRNPLTWFRSSDRQQRGCAGEPWRVAMMMESSCSDRGKALRSEGQGSVCADCGPRWQGQGRSSNRSRREEPLCRARGNRRALQHTPCRARSGQLSSSGLCPEHRHRGDRAPLRIVEPWCRRARRRHDGGRSCSDRAKHHARQRQNGGGRGIASKGQRSWRARGPRRAV